MKKVSVIVACYNEEKFVEQCIMSLVNQTIGVESLEIIAVNDASTDATLERLCALEKRYPDSIVVVDCKENGRSGTARNIGISYATAPYISFVDADDWMESCAYEKLYNKAIEYDCDAVAAGYVEEFSRESTPVGRNGKADQFYIVENDADRAGFVGVDFGVGIPGNLYRRSMVIDNRIYFPEGYFYEDDYWYVLSMHYIFRAYIIGEDFYHYYQHPESTIHKRNSLHQLDRAKMEERKLRELIDRGIFQRFPMLYEYEFLWRYYMQMLYVLFMGFDEVHYDLIVALHDNAYDLFPNYRENIFVKRIFQGAGGEYMKNVYDSLDRELTVELIDSLKEQCIADGGGWINVAI